MTKTSCTVLDLHKTFVKIQKDQPKTVRGFALTRYLLHMHIDSVRGKKKSVKNAKISENKICL